LTAPPTDRRGIAIPKGGNRSSEKDMLEGRARAERRFDRQSSGLGRCRYREAAPFAAALAALALPGCSSLGDLGYVDQPAVADNIHAWVGQEAAARWGAPISLANLTEDERTLRDLAFPLIQPAYTRDRWDQVVYEYGQKRDFQRSCGLSIRRSITSISLRPIIGPPQGATIGSMTTSATTPSGWGRFSTSPTA
jgi:hypothetical protein